MHELEDFFFFGADTMRSRAYIDLLAQADFFPSSAVIVQGSTPPGHGRESPPSKHFNSTDSLPRQLERWSIPFEIIESESVNSSVVVESVSRIAAPHAIFSAAGGAIVKEPLFNTGKMFLHVHPGPLPQLRGSTPMYYSLLMKSRLTATAIFLAPAIDTGHVLHSETFEAPADRASIDAEFDPFMRATVLVNAIRLFIATGSWNLRQQTGEGETVYVIHPVLKHIAILASPHS